MSNTAIQQSAQQPSPTTTFAKYLDTRKENLRAIIPKTLTLDRVMKVAIAAFARTPDLQECSLESIYLAINQSVQLGLEPNGPLQHAYLVPFFNKKTNRKECQFIPGYKGLIALARRSGEIQSIESHVVYEKDFFKVKLGSGGFLNHEPHFDGPAGKPRLVYAFARLKDGGEQFEVMTLEQVNAIKARSKASNYGPWQTDYEEMARKTVVRRLTKYLPMSVELAEALDADADRDADRAPINLGALASEPVPQQHDEPMVELPAAAAPTQADAMRGELRATADAAVAEKRTSAPKTNDEGEVLPDLFFKWTSKNLEAVAEQLEKAETAAALKKVEGLFATYRGEATPEEITELTVRVAHARSKVLNK